MHFIKAITGTLALAACAALVPSASAQTLQVLTTGSSAQFGPFAVAAYIVGAYWFTSSTSFANPAVTLARAASNTFAGIRAADVPGFITAQLLGAAAATAMFRWLVPSLPSVADRVVDRAGDGERLP